MLAIEVTVFGFALQLRIQNDTFCNITFFSVAF